MVTGLPGAAAGPALITLVNLQTGHYTTGASKEDGSFGIPFLAPPGSYLEVRQDPTTLSFGASTGAGTTIRVPVGGNPYVAFATLSRANEFSGSVDVGGIIENIGISDSGQVWVGGDMTDRDWMSGETLMLSGDLDELQDVEATIRDIQAGTGLAEGPDNCDPTCDTGPPNAGRSQDLDDLAAFMASLEFPPNPHSGPNDELSESARRGYNLFYSPVTGCSGCHTPPLFTDHLRHDIGTGGGPDENRGPEFDTPSLRGVYATAPYLHDGRATTLLSVLTTHNPGDLHGSTSALTEDEAEDIVSFLESLTNDPPLFRKGFE